jgi:hypothetical protein
MYVDSREFKPGVDMRRISAPGRQVAISEESAGARTSSAVNGAAASIAGSSPAKPGNDAPL